MSDASENKPELQKILEQSTAKASAKVEKNLLIEKQNAELKRLMRILPFQIFLLVADADRKIDPKEVAQFREFLSRREKNCSNVYTRRMFHATVVNYTALTNRFLTGQIKKSFAMVEKTLTYIQLCVPQPVMAEICADLKGLAVAVAGASGGFLGMTSPVSKEEEQVLAALDTLFSQAIANSQADDTPGRLQLEF